MNEPVRLVTAVELVPMAVDAEVVEHLEKLLEGARRGDFNGIMTATLSFTDPGHYVGAGTGFCGCVRQHVHTALGTVDVLKYRMMTELMEWG